MAKPDGRPNLSVADWVGPEGVPDHVGMFAVTAGHGVDALVRSFEAANDDYSAILAKALADRLAEAFAERLHERVRRELWGYAPDEALSNDDLIAERYQGIRPAPGYPATPDAAFSTVPDTSTSTPRCRNGSRSPASRTSSSGGTCSTCSTTRASASRTPRLATRTRAGSRRRSSTTAACSSR